MSGLVWCAYAQQVHIEIPPNSIALNESFTITVEVEGEEITNYTPFPEIEGLKKIKNGLSMHETETMFQGKKKKLYLMEQIYHPQREGMVSIKPFKMTINQKTVESAGATIKIKPYDKLKGELREPKDLKETKEPENKLIEVKEDAFLGLDVNKTEVFVGEGICVSLSFYVATDNPAPMKYTDLNKQVENINKQLKPAGCWEENFNISEVPEAPKVTLNGKSYYQNKFYEAVFFPLNDKSITFPTVELKMLVKRKINPRDNINDSKVGEWETVFFKSTPKMVQVKPLPTHPLREQVAVGKFFLQEGVPYRTIKTGEGVSYYFKIVGEGNIAALHEPQSNNTNSQLLVYSPILQTSISRNTCAVTGSAVFDYPIVPQESGTYSLRNHFEWIFFNLTTQRYDTLRPQSQLVVSGESYKGAIGDFKTHPLYKKMNQKIPFFSQEEKKQLLNWFNISSVVMVFLLFVSFLKRKRKEH